MDHPTHTLIVTGYPGAGKTHLIERLTAMPGAVVPCVEVGGLERLQDTIDQVTDASPVLAVADAVNFASTLASEHSGAFASAQIASADLVAVARGDVIDPEPVVKAIAELTDAPILDAREITREVIAEISPARRPIDTPPPRATDWSYRGGAQLRSRDIDAILERRPEGLYRLSGQIRTDEGGLVVEIVGRARETRRIDEPRETCLSALSPGCLVHHREIDLWFTEAVTSSTHLMGRFSYR